MKIHLLRHTTAQIKKGICYGHSDIPVAETFKNELSKIMEFLSDLTWDAIYSSPLKRCVVLADEMNKSGKDIVFDDRLKELNFGDWELMKWSDIEKTDYAKKWFKDYIKIACPGGESYLNLIDRVSDLIPELKKHNGFQSIFIVTHGGIIRAFSNIINQIELKDSFKTNIAFGEIVTMEI